MRRLDIAAVTVLSVGGLHCAPRATERPNPAERVQRARRLAEPIGALDHEAPRPLAGGVLHVNQDTLTVEDVTKPLMPALFKEAAGLPAEQQLGLVIRRCQEELVRQIHDLLLYQEASGDITDDMMSAVDQYVDQEIKNRVNRDFDGRQTRFEAHLAAQNMNMEAAREVERRRLIVVKYLQENLLPKITDPTRRELVDYYHANLEEYSEPARRELLMIDVSKAGGAEAAATAIRAAAERLGGGEDFRVVAREISQGIHAGDGGNWGDITSPLQGRYARPSEVFFTLGENQVSEIIETADAFFIVKAGRVQEESILSFTEVQQELVERYRNAQFDFYRARLLRKLLAQAVIEPDEDAFLKEVVESATQRLQEG